MSLGNDPGILKIGDFVACLKKNSRVLIGVRTRNPPARSYSTDYAILLRMSDKSAYFVADL